MLASICACNLSAPGNAPTLRKLLADTMHAVARPPGGGAQRNGSAYHRSHERPLPYQAVEIILTSSTRSSLGTSCRTRPGCCCCSPCRPAAHALSSLGGCSPRGTPAAAASIDCRRLQHLSHTQHLPAALLHTTGPYTAGMQASCINVDCGVVHCDAFHSSRQSLMQ